MSSKLSLNKARVLVTGGAGFIGSHLVDALVEQGATVRVLDDLSTGRRENLERHIGHVEFIHGDIRSLATCEKAMDGVTLVLHQAAIASVALSLEAPAITTAVNVHGSANVFQAARDAKVSRVVFASSASVYGLDARGPNREGTEGTRLSPYALSKAMVEQLARVHVHCFGLNVIGLRYFNVYGPRQDPQGAYASVIPRFLSARVSGRTPVIYGSGEQSRDFVYVADVVQANLLALTEELPAYGVYNVGTGHSTTIAAVAEAVDALIPGGVPFMHEPTRNEEVQSSVADMTLSRRDLGFNAETVLWDGLEETLSHLVRKSASVHPA